MRMLLVLQGSRTVLYLFQNAAKEWLQPVWAGTMIASVWWLLLAGVVVFHPVRDRPGESERERIRRERRVVLRVLVGLAVILTNVLCIVATIVTLYMVCDGRMEMTARSVTGAFLGPVFVGVLGWLVLMILLDKI